MTTNTPPQQALATADALFTLLDRWVERGWLRRLDRVFADFLRRETEQASPALLLAAALASHQLGRGHVCLDLARTLASPDLALSLPPEGDGLDTPPPLPSDVMHDLDLSDWQQALDAPSLVGDGPGNTPLVLVGERLYLRRYWQHETTILQHIHHRLQAQPAMDPDIIARTLGTLFPASQALDWQKVACALAARSPFAVITGGPGTGKTTTVVKLLALLQAQALGAGRPALRIHLAAPTGKAAARLNESIASQVAGLDLSALAKQAGLSAQPDPVASLRAAIPTSVTTLHRLLGARPDSRHFRHHAHRLLPLDVLVVDEASMVDVEMMAALLDALPPRSHLVLLGDKDQLASVEAGSILGDLCARAAAGHYTPATADWLARACGHALPDIVVDPAGEPLDQAIAMLRVSHRFDATSGIGRLAAAINDTTAERDQEDTIRRVLDHGYADLAYQPLDGSDDPRLERLVTDGLPENFPAAGRHRHQGGQELPTPAGYRHYLEVMQRQRPADLDDQEALDDWARAVLSAHGQFQLLCALRRGPWGVEGLNQRIQQTLGRQGLLESRSGPWYPGRPVLVTRNNYGLGLMNGDIGITLATEGNGGLRVAFPAGDGSDRIHWVLPSRLKAVETVFAMTVHKSQGSEFTHAALILPDTPNPILTRELVYTGMTRARHWLTLGEPGHHQLQKAARRRVERVSGLRILFEQ